MINFKQVVGFAFLPRIYTGVAKSILTAMGIVLNDTFSKGTTLFDKMHYDLSITPQVCFLEKILNDKYDDKERRIRIQDIGTVKGYFFFRQTDPKEQKFYFGEEETKYFR